MITLANTQASSGLKGHLHLVCQVDADQRSYLSHQSFQVPVHLSKPYWEADALIVNVINPNAGLLAGDQIQCDIKVRAQAHLLITNPGATRLHTMKSDRASVQQILSVETGGRLDYFPELLIPQRGSRYQQVTRINVEEGGELFYWESMAPGRVSSQEAFLYDYLNFQTELKYAHELVVRDHYRLSPSDQSLIALQNPFETAYWASALVISQKLSPQSSCWTAIRQMHGPDLWIGASQIRSKIWNIRILGRDSLNLKKAILCTRQAVYLSAGWKEIPLRKT